VEQLFEAAQGNSLLLAVVGFVYLGLVVVLAILAVFTSNRAALDVLRVLWVRRGAVSRDVNGAGGNRAASGSAERPPSQPGD
jgi:hypothetical protein